MQNPPQHTHQAPSATNNNALVIYDANYIMAGTVVIMLPFVVLLSVFLRKRYRIEVRRRRIATLEKLWNLSPTGREKR